MSLNLHHNSEHENLVISSAGWLHENRIFRFSKLHENIVFYPNQKLKFFTDADHCMKYRIRWENKNFDVTGTL